MANIKSDLTNKQIPGNQMRQFEVSDETDFNIDEIKRRMSERGIPVDDNVYQEMQQMNQGQRGVEPSNLAYNIKDVEQEVKATRMAQMTGKSRLKPSAKRRIEMLCGMTRLTKEVDLDENMKISIKTLKTKELREALLLASQFDGTVESPFEIRRQLLARSIYAINGTDISLFLEDNSVDAVFDFLDELDESILIRIYTEYLELARSATQKYSINSPEQAQEVAEDLKK